MKKILLFCCGLLVTSVLVFVSCKKDKEITPTVNNYFSVANASLIHKNLPEPTLDEKITVEMNEIVITGGTSLVKITSGREAKKIMVGMKDQDGYYELPRSAQDDCAFLMMINQDIRLDENKNSFTIQVAIEDGRGDISQICESVVTLLEVGTGQLQVSLSFDHPVDVDLILVEPNGDKIGFFNEISHNGGVMDINSNYGCIIDGINNENITYSDSAYVEPGLYKVFVDLYENCSADKPTNYVVTVHYHGSPITVTSGSNPYNGTFAADAPGNYSQLGNLVPVITFEIPDKSQKSGGL